MWCIKHPFFTTHTVIHVIWTWNINRYSSYSVLEDSASLKIERKFYDYHTVILSKIYSESFYIYTFIKSETDLIKGHNFCYPNVQWMLLDFRKNLDLMFYTIVINILGWEWCIYVKWFTVNFTQNNSMVIIKFFFLFWG
jgi:hypothetical protein